VVVNPNSGPGNAILPDGNYTREIPRLNAYSNVRTVGYVSTSWASRPLSSALQDISTYSGWPKNSTVQGLSVQGIFFDETPSVYNASGANFLNSAAAAIKFQPGLGINPLVSLVYVFSFRQFWRRSSGKAATFRFLLLSEFGILFHVTHCLFFIELIR
jgi:Spherulation-specific family 4